MSKLTKKEIQEHTKALELLNSGNLTDDDKLFIFENYREDAYHINSQSGAFFTPYGLARDFILHIPYSYRQPVKIIDMCAGIGIFSYTVSKREINWRRCPVDITCVEINPDYVEIGKKLLPDARWICGDILDPDFLKSLGRYDCAISNPPFGKIKSSHQQVYSSRLFEYMVIEAAAKIADEGVFIVPQMSTPFAFSGNVEHRWLDECRARRFEQKTGIILDYNYGIDTAQYKDGWHGVAPACEIVCCDFTDRPGQISFDMGESA